MRALCSVISIPYRRFPAPIRWCRFDQIVAGVASTFNVPVADVHSAFQGRHGMLLIALPGAAPDEVSPTNAGYYMLNSRAT